MTGSKLRALALAFVVGLAVVALALAGSGAASAAAGNVSVSPSPVTSSATVAANATADVPGNDLTFVVDADGDGTVVASEAIGTTSSNASTGNGSVTATLGTFVPGDGTYSVYVVEEGSADGADDTSYPVADPATFYDANASVVVDDTPPTITEFNVTNPKERDVVVTFNASERLGDVDARVDGPAGGTLEEVDFVSTGTGPYAYEATFFPAADGEYSVTLTTAADAAGNDGAGSESDGTLAAIAGRSADAVFDRSSPVFLGERDVDVSPVVGDGMATFRAVGGGEDRVVRANASALDVTPAAGFVPGAYDATGDGSADLVVERPTVDDVSVVLAGDSDDVDVGGAYLQDGDPVTVRASFRFGTVDDLALSVVDPSGVDVAPMLTDGTTLTAADDTSRLDTGEVALEPGTYTVSLSAETLEANATATFELVDRETTVSLDRTRVVAGRPVTATVFGAPGGTAVVRLPVTALANESTPAATVFEHTGDVSVRAGGPRHVGAELALGRDGIAQVRFSTLNITPETVAVEAVDGSIANLSEPSADAVPLQVRERRVVLDEHSDAAAINEEVTVTGGAPQIDAVRAYVRLGEEWRPLGDSEPVRAAVDAGGGFELTIPVTGELAYPGNYQVAVVGVEEGSSAYGSDGTLTRTELERRPRAVFTLRTSVGGTATDGSR